MASFIRPQISRSVRICFICVLLGTVALTSAYVGWRYHIHRVAVYAERAQHQEAVQQAARARVTEFSDFFRRPLMAEPPKDDIRKRLRESL